MRGSIIKRGAKSWRLKFDLGRDPLTGKRQIAYETVRGTKRKAEETLTQRLNEQRQGSYVAPEKTTVSEFLDRWERDWAAVNVSPKTLERYRELLRKHVRPRVGSSPVQKLRPVTLQELYAALQRPVKAGGAGLAPRTVGHVHRVLHRALGHAVTWGVIVQNPAAAVSPPPVEAEEIQILTGEQVGDVLTKLRGRALYPVVAVALGTGMRRGEILALRWGDVSLEEGKLRVERALEQTKAGLRFKSPKTRHGRRNIALPASTLADLRAHRLVQQQQRLALGLGKLPDDALVFGTVDGEPRSPNGLTREWVRNVAVLKLPAVNFHALRHTHASQLIASGMDVLTISRRLGHGSPTITLAVYGHLFANTDDRAAQVIDAALNRARTE